MTTLDLTPLFRSTVGFDRLHRMLESATRMDAASGGYPPYNIERTGEDSYRIVLAVAGFGEGDLSLEVEHGVLTVKGQIDDKTEEGESTFLHRGIAGRAFERRFQLAEHIEVTGADLENGLLSIDLVREVPEALKPRTIEIANGKKGPSTAKAIEKKAA